MSYETLTSRHIRLIGTQSYFIWAKLLDFSVTWVAIGLEARHSDGMLVSLAAVRHRP